MLSLQKSDLKLVIAWSLLAFVIARYFSDNDFLHLAILLPYVFFAPGYIWSKMILPRPAPIVAWAISSVLLSFLTLYPATILTVLIEGQTAKAIFQTHLSNSMTSLALITLLGCALALRFRDNHLPKNLRFSIKPLLTIIVALLIFSSIVFNNLGRANVFGDEYDISYQAYNLIDGIADGRKSFLLSFNTHPPLIMDISHYVLQIANPRGLERLTDHQYRLPEALVGLVTIVLVYFLSRDFFGKWVALLATLMLSLNNYHIWLSRFVEREIFLTPFMIGFVFAAKKILVDKNRQYWILAGLAIGGGLLIKVSALIMVGLASLLLIVNWKSALIKRAFLKSLILATVVFTPVIIYNLFAYKLTGYADSFFSRFLPGAKSPFATPAVPGALFINPQNIFFLLLDLFSLPVFVTGLLAVASAIFLLRKKVSQPLIIILLWLFFSVIFYIPTVVRAYYLHFVTIPWVILIALLLANLRPRFLAFIIALILFSYSYFYSLNTNVRSNFTLPLSYDDSGRTGKQLLYPDFPRRNFSLAARSWSEDRGWTAAVKFFQAQSEGYCLEFSPELDEIALKRYFWYKDEVKRHFLGAYAPARFPNCSGPSSNVLKFYLTNRPNGTSTYAIIKNNAGEPSFYVYRQT